MKKKFLALLICLVLVFLAYPYFAPKPQVNRTNYEKIQLGMTSNEVQAILRVPPGDYSTGPVHFHSVKQLALAGIVPPGKEKTWNCDDGQITLWFDNQGVVVFKHMVPGFRVEGSNFL